jgi:hypothetical protein
MKSLKETISEALVTESKLQVSQIRNQLDKDDAWQFDDAIKELKISKTSSIDKKTAEKLGQYLLDEIGSDMQNAIEFIEDEFDLTFESTN